MLFTVTSFIQTVCFGLMLNYVFISIQDFVGGHGDFLLFLKNIGAPKHHLVEIDATDKKPGHHFEVVVAVSRIFNTKRNYLAATKNEIFTGKSK